MLGTYLRRLAACRSIRSIHSGPIRCLPRRIPPSGAPPSAAGKFKVFRDADSTVVRDSIENLSLPLETNLADDFDEFEGLNVKRGIAGVFDVEDLVETLRRENAKNIFVCRVPAEHAFVSHICVVSGRSARHMLAMAEFIKKLYKRKRRPEDPVPRIEGKGSADWIALDLGNIALHIFSENVRKTYDIEQLWSVGSEFDSEFNKANSSIVKLLEEHSMFLDDLKPATDDEEEAFKKQ